MQPKAFAIFRKVLAALKPIRAPQCISSAESTSVEAGAGGVGGRGVIAFSWMSTVLKLFAGECEAMTAPFSPSLAV